MLRTRQFFNTFDFEMCFAPQQCALFQHLNFQKWSEHLAFFNILTCKCASRRNGCALFFNISTSKSAPSMRCFVHFLTSGCASGHNGVQFFVSHLGRWLRTRCFSKVYFSIFRIHKLLEKHSTPFLPFRAPASSFF